VARGHRQRPHVLDDHADLLRRKGAEHEAAYLKELHSQGRQVENVLTSDPWDFATSARATEKAMRAGAEIIYQATFVRGDWRGRADFLERVDQPTALGAWGYEALDAKLARAEKPTYVLQLCFYTEAIASIQHATPDKMHVLLGIGERRTLRHADFAAYYRRVRASFLAALAHAAPTEPYRFEQLPRPAPGDVIFDIEGDPFWEPPRVRHFLFGQLTREPNTREADSSTWRYQTIWAHDRAGERQALEQLVDFFHDRLEQHPDMHVYHYGAY